MTHSIPYLPAMLSIALALSLSACGWFDKDDPQHDVTPHAVPTADPAAPTAFTGKTWGFPAQRDTVRGYIQKLMDESRVVPDTAAKKGGPRGSPGSFAKLSGPDREEFVSAIIHGAERFLPKSLKDEEKWALVCAEISIESAFVPGTRGVNPGDNSKISVSPLQITIPGMWDDIFKQYAKLPGLTHYDGKPWDPKDTTDDMLEHSIWDGITASLFCITEQGRRGCPDWFGGPDGPCPKSMRTSFLAWVIGAPALKTPGGDLAGQRDAYIASISTDLKLLGFSETLIDAAF